MHRRTLVYYFLPYTSIIGYQESRGCPQVCETSRLFLCPGSVHEAQEEEICPLRDSPAGRSQNLPRAVRQAERYHPLRTHTLPHRRVSSPTTQQLTPLSNVDACAPQRHPSVYARNPHSRDAGELAPVGRGGRVARLCVRADVCLSVEDL